MKENVFPLQLSLRMKVLLLAPIFAMVAIGLVYGDECHGTTEKVNNIISPEAINQGPNCPLPSDYDYGSGSAEVT